MTGVKDCDYDGSESALIAGFTRPAEHGKNRNENRNDKGRALRGPFSVQGSDGAAMAPTPIGCIIIPDFLSRKVATVPFPA